MQVSAVSANRYQAYDLVNNISKADDDNKNENSEMVFNSLVPFAKKNTQEFDMSKIFESINEWKYFCHKQIAAGKLDIIA